MCRHIAGLKDVILSAIEEAVQVGVERRGVRTLEHVVALGLIPIKGPLQTVHARAASSCAVNILRCKLPFIVAWRVQRRVSFRLNR